KVKFKVLTLVYRNIHYLSCNCKWSKCVINLPNFRLVKTGLVAVILPLKNDTTDKLK
ncbi:unnamed protein product, partial [Heterotrigona itama]